MEAQGESLPYCRWEGGQPRLFVEFQVRPLVAGAVVLAGRGLALPHVCLAVLVGVAGPTLTGVVVDLVDAGRLVAARR